LFYTSVSAFDTTSITNSFGVALYQNQTSFTILAKGSSGGGSVLINSEPQSTSVAVGSQAGFNVGFSAPGSVGVQWFFSANNSTGPAVALANGTQSDGSVVAGAQYSNLTISNAQLADAGSYFVVLTYNGQVTSNTASLTVAALPAFTQQPLSVTAGAGQTVVFCAVAADTNTPADTISYQWYLNGNVLSDGGNISGSSSSTLYLANVSSAGAGNYVCTATNPAGYVVSNTAALAYSTTTDLGRIMNVSIRNDAGTGANQLIAGFVIGGAGTSGNKTLLVRGDGPLLTSLGLPGLPDPLLDLFQPSVSTTVPIAANQGWNNSTTITSIGTAVGAYPLPANSLDSALAPTLAPGAYTANVTGASNDTGIALAEVYDATSGFTATTPRLINVSGRSQVGTGASQLIAGFVIGGSTAKTVLVRGMGPTLAGYGVTGVLPDPTVAVYQPSVSTTVPLYSNTGWGGNPQISSVASLIGAFGFASGSSADSALLVSLPPGVYTANVTGASNDTGVALVEVYEVP
jgi:hypothetical protein